ncbi:hypothetical protein V6N13_142363 [Hibiscus sabdariffa]
MQDKASSSVAGFDGEVDRSASLKVVGQKSFQEPVLSPVQPEYEPSIQEESVLSQPNRSVQPASKHLVYRRRPKQAQFQSLQQPASQAQLLQGQVSENCIANQPAEFLEQVQPIESVAQTQAQPVEGIQQAQCYESHCMG